MRRRSYLAALSSVGIGALAGCVSGDERSTATSATTSAGTPMTATQTTTEASEYLHCETPVTPTTPSEGGDYRQSYPDFPDELSEITAHSFARRLERARWRNEVAADYGDRLRHFDFLMERSDVRSVEEGYLVDYSVTFGFGYTSEDGVAIEADYGADGTYFVAPSVVRRSEDDADPRDPAKSEIVLCRPGE